MIKIYRCLPTLIINLYSSGYNFVVGLVSAVFFDNSLLRTREAIGFIDTIITKTKIIFLILSSADTESMCSETNTSLL